LLLIGSDIKTNSIIKLSREDRKQGTYIVGVNGTGKTVLLINAILSDAEAGDGLCFLDPHGDAVETILTLLPEHRKNDIILFDPSDYENPFGLNLFECKNLDDPKEVDLICSEIVGTFKKLYRDSWGPRLEDILRHSILPVINCQGLTLLDHLLVLSSPIYRRRVLEKIKDPLIHNYWDNIFPFEPKEIKEWLASSYNKIGRFLANPLIRNIVSQPKSSFDLRKIMDEGKILLVNLSKGKIGEDNSILLGSVLVGKILIAALSRADILEEKRKPFHLIVDEYQSFATESFPILQSEARKYRIDTMVAHQYRDQVDSLNKGSTLNVGNFILFRITGKDSLELSLQFDNTPPEPESKPEPVLHRTSQKGVFRTGDSSEFIIGKGNARLYSDVSQEMANKLSNLPNYQCWCKLVKDGQLEEFHIKTLPLPDRINSNQAKEIKNNSKKLGRKRADVEEAINKKFGTAEILTGPRDFE